MFTLHAWSSLQCTGPNTISIFGSFKLNFRLIFKIWFCENFLFEKLPFSNRFQWFYFQLESSEILEFTRAVCPRPCELMLERMTANKNMSWFFHFTEKAKSTKEINKNNGWSRLVRLTRKWGFALVLMSRPPWNLEITRLSSKPTK